MSHCKILFGTDDRAICPIKISEKIKAFGDGYSNATKEVITNSEVLDRDGEKFVKCASRILSSFGMTRGGPLHKSRISGTLLNCWDVVGDDLMRINGLVRNGGLPRDRYVLELDAQAREGLIADIWRITKKLLPFTMGETTFGLVGASKILFSVFPEIALPIDNAQWLHVFKTVDTGDVLRRMVLDIQTWEENTGRQLNDLDDSKRLTTLPSVYNVMAMNARPQN